MNLQAQQQHFEKLVDKMRQIMLKKGNDYSADDRLSNFKQVGFVCGTNAEIACLHLIATKVSRLNVLLSSEKKPDNESIEDSVLDLTIYGILLHMIHTEKTESQRTTTPQKPDEIKALSGLI